MTDRLKVLRETFGTAPDTSTIKGIMLYTKLWIEREEVATTKGLKQGCLQMLRTLDSAIFATEKDLDSTGQTDESLADPVERCMEAYERLKEVVAEIAEAASKEDREEVSELLVDLEDAAAFLGEAQEDLNIWLAEPVLRCPKCGASDQDPCSVCHLELLFPDPKGGGSAGDRSALLPQEFGVVFEAYTAVRNGEKTLSDLIRVLPSIEKTIRSYTAIVNASLIEKPESSTLLATRETLVELSRGIQIMRETSSTRRMTDLQDGWLLTFRNAVHLQEHRLELMEELGGQVGQNLAVKERAATAQQDSFSFSQEE
jgi:rubrerythrin